MKVHLDRSVSAGQGLKTGTLVSNKEMKTKSSFFTLVPRKFVIHSIIIKGTPDAGGLAQLARALAWHARGHRFDSDILHE